MSSLTKRGNVAIDLTIEEVSYCMGTDKKIIGGFEIVQLPELYLQPVAAKIDTGAYHGAAHVDDFYFIDDGVVAKVDDREITFPEELVKKTIVRSSSGHESRRAVVKTKIKVSGIERSLWIGLTSREDMKFSVLIGRRFLRDNKLLVDVGLNSEYDTDGENNKREKSE